jgi:hypothetical protein
MRKISIVQRRLETGLDLTQAELRALQREARSQSDQAEYSEKTVTAVEDPLSFLPPTRPEVTRPNRTRQPETDSEQHTAAVGIGVSRQEGSGGPEEVASSRITDKVGSIAEAREVILADESYGEPPEGSSTLVSENVLSTYGEELRAAVNEIFAREDFSFEVESGPVGTEKADNDSPDEQPGVDVHGWQSEREVLFPSQAPREGSSSETSHITEGKSPKISELLTPEPTAKEDTLVLFLLQVPRGALAAKFSASQDTESPFAGQLRLYSEAEDSMPLPGETSEFDVNLPPEGLVRLSTGRVGNNGHEWALISLDEEARAYATFDLRAGRNLKATAAVFSKSPSRRASVSLRTSLSEDNGFVLANPTDGPVVVRLALFDEQGNQVSSARSQELDPLPAGKQVAIFAKGIFRDFPGITSFKGKMVAEVVGDGLIWTAGLSQNDGVLSFLPVTELDKASQFPA